MSDLGWDLRIRRFKEQRRNLRNKDLLWVSSLWPTMQSKFKRIVHMGKVKSGQPRAMRRPWYFWVWLHPTSEDTWPRARRGSQLDLQVKVELVSEWTEVLNEKCIKKREAQAGKGIYMGYLWMLESTGARTSIQGVKAGKIPCVPWNLGGGWNILIKRSGVINT